MGKIKFHKIVAFLIAIALILSSFVMPITAFANEAYDNEVYDNEIYEYEAYESEVSEYETFEPIAGALLSTPSNLILNRGHMPELSFGGPMGLSWAEVEDRISFTVFAFQSQGEDNPNEAYAYVDGIDALYLSVNTAFGFDLNDGPFWFRVQAVGDDLASSELSESIGPFWYSYQSDEFAANPAGSFAIFNNPDIPVIVLDSRRPIERETQGNIVGDTHVPWPNAAAVDEGITHEDFKNAVLAAWEDFIENDLTDAQRATLNPALEYRDIHIFLF